MDIYTVIGGQFVTNSESDDSPADKPFRVLLESKNGEKREMILSGDDLNKVKIGKTYRIDEDGTLRRVVHVVAAVICKDGKVFATQRGYGEWKDHWEFPGGKVEKSETPENALIREIREELTVSIRVDRYLTTVEYDYPDFHLVMACYVCSVTDGKLTLLEHEAARWLSAEKLDTVDWLPADVLVLSSVRDLLGKM